MVERQRSSDRVEKSVPAYVVGLAALFVLAAAIFAPLVNHLARDSIDVGVATTDYPVHNALAARMRDERRLLLPHPLYHLLVIGTQVVRERIGAARVAAKPIDQHAA